MIKVKSGKVRLKSKKISTKNVRKMMANKARDNVKAMNGGVKIGKGADSISHLC